MATPQRPPALPPLPKEPLEGIDESTWLDVIHKMDEVYSQLVADETALEEKNQQLEQSQRFIYGLLSAMSDVLVACDEQGRIEQTNAALCVLTGRSDAELRAQPLESLLADAAGGERLRRALAGVGRGGSNVELELRDAQGHPAPVELNVTPRFDASGRCVGHVFVGRPLGELKRAYRQLQDAHEALKRTQQQLLHSEKMASLGRLVAGVAHELNNPISFVLGNVHALQRYGERLAAYLGAIHAGASKAERTALRERLRIDHVLADLPSLMDGTLEGARRTADIVQGLKRFSALDREERVPVDLNAVVERAIHWVSKGTSPTLRVHWTPGAPCTVLGSAGQLLQVVMNLVQNAHDAAVSGPSAEPQVWLSVEHDASTATLRCRDNGPGISPANLSRIFEPFFTTKAPGTGTGLGLSISYGIVERHGGTLSAANVQGEGACFTVELPLAR